MQRPEKIIHDDGSKTFEGDGFTQDYLHEYDHKKGKGETLEHKGQWGHSDMHKKGKK